MTTPFETSHLKAYLSFPLKGKDATNRLLVGVALIVASFFIPLIPLLPAYGYYYRLIQRIIHGEGPEMPAWDEWGRLFIDGLKFFVINTVYLLPGIFVYMAGFTVYMVSIFSFAFESGRSNPSFSVFPMFAIFILFISMFLSILLMFLGGVPMPVATSHAIGQDSLGAAFHLKTITRLLRHKAADYLIAWLVLFGLFGLLYAAYMLLYLSVVLCIILPIVLGGLGFYCGLVGWAIFADIYRQGAQELGLGLAPQVSPAAPFIAPLPGEGPATPARSPATPAKSPMMPKPIAEMAADLGALAAETGDTAGEPPTAAAEAAENGLPPAKAVSETFAAELPPPAVTLILPILDMDAPQDDQAGPSSGAAYPRSSRR